MTEPALYQWPSTARYGRVVPKTKFYEHGQVSSNLRKRFVDEVQRVTWAYKLAETTINLAGTESVPEIQVFLINAKSEDVSDGVLASIDKSIPFPIIFEVSRPAALSQETRMVAAYKDLGGRAPKVSGHLSTAWLASEARSPMPSAIDLPSLYKELLAPLLPVPTLYGEGLAEAAARVEQARKLEREIKRLERRIRNEAQFNRKVQLRRQLLDHQNRLALLIDAQPNDETAKKE